VVFHERDGNLMMVEAMTKADASGKNAREILGFASQTGEIVTGLPREAIRSVVAQAQRELP
jgi:hypothetical protein